MRFSLGGGLAILAATGMPAAANPADLFGFGARGQAMGGAQVATVDDTSANYYNPALLAGQDDIRVDLGYQVALPHLAIEGHESSVDHSRGFAIGLAVPGWLGGMRVAVGVGLFLPDQHITRTRTLPREQPRWQQYDNRPQRLLLAANVAIELPHGISLGGGLAYMSSTQGSVALDGTVGFPDPDASQLNLAIDVDLRTIRYPQAGVAWRARPWLTVAASYRGGFKLDLDQTFDIAGDIGMPGAEPLVADGFLHLRTRAQDLFQPAQLTAGVGARLTPRLAIGFDLSWHRWSAFENPASTVDLDIDVGDFNDLINIPPQTPLPAPHFHDIAIARLGAEVLAAARRGRRWRLRGGYAYEPTPAPAQVGATNFIDGDKHTLSLGGGVELPGLNDIIVRPVSFDLSLAAIWLPERAHQKILAVAPEGDLTSRGVVFAASLASRWRF